MFHILEDVGYVVEKENHLVQLEMRHILCWDAPLHNSIRDKFPTVFENVVLANLKPFFQLDHQVGINLLIGSTN